MKGQKQSITVLAGVILGCFILGLAAEELLLLHDQTMTMRGEMNLLQAHMDEQHGINVALTNEIGSLQSTIYGDSNEIGLVNRVSATEKGCVITLPKVLNHEEKVFHFDCSENRTKSPFTVFVSPGMVQR